MSIHPTNIEVLANRLGILTGIYGQACYDSGYDMHLGTMTEIAVNARRVRRINRMIRKYLIILHEDFWP